jgi:hypothetical protein
MVPSIWIGFIQIEMDLMAYLKWGDENGYKSKYANDSTKKSVNVVANDYVKYPIWIHLNIIQWMVF